jgi:hypothetical protein
MPQSFEFKKQLRFVITLGTGKFGSSDNNQITLAGFRASADITKAGGLQMNELSAQIYGVSQEDMNSITTLMWKPILRIKNRVEVFAIDGENESQVFGGDIVNAWGDYQNQPDVFLHIKAQGAFYNQIAAVKPLSINGTSKVAVIMERIANDMALTFVNNGVDVIINDCYLANTLTEKAKQLANDAGIDLYIDDNTLSITPRYTPLFGQVPLISPSTGLVGYPTFDGVGVNIKTLYSPAIVFGGKIKIETDIEQAAGEWIVRAISHRLESEKPNGAWFSSIIGTQVGLAITK